MCLCYCNYFKAMYFSYHCDSFTIQIYFNMDIAIKSIRPIETIDISNLSVYPKNFMVQHLNV